MSAVATGERRERWTELAIKLSEGGNHYGAHWVFVRKVLGIERAEALKMAATFYLVPLTRKAADLIADEWELCDECRGPVAGGVELCASCVSSEED